MPLLMAMLARFMAFVSFLPVTIVVLGWHLEKGRSVDGGLGVHRSILSSFPLSSVVLRISAVAVASSLLLILASRSCLILQEDVMRDDVLELLLY